MVYFVFLQVLTC